MSPAKLIIVLIFVPAEGNISKRVTTGPSFTFTTFISILKSEKTFSNSCEFSSIFFLKFSLSDFSTLASSISNEGDKYLSFSIDFCWCS